MITATNQYVTFRLDGEVYAIDVLFPTDRVDVLSPRTLHFERAPEVPAHLADFCQSLWFW